MNTDQTAAYNEIVSILTDSFTVADAAVPLLKALCQPYQLKNALLWELNEEQNLLICKGIFSEETEISPELTKLLEQMTCQLGDDLPGRVWQDKAPVLIADVKKETHFARQSYLKTANLTTVFGFPIIYNDNVIAVVEFFRDQTTPFDDTFLKQVANKIGVFIEREHQQQRMVMVQHAGMSNTAATILHNVGNILNSANVSMSVIKENIEQAHYKKLFAVIATMKEHLPVISSYLTDDQKGKLIPAYLIALGANLENSVNIISHESTCLQEKIQHIKDVVAMQGFLGGKMGTFEKIFLPEIIDSVIGMTSVSLQEKHIILQKKYEENPFLITDRSRLIQILVNLIQNAKEALLECNDQSIITVSISKKQEDKVAIAVTDTGSGISEENLSKLFSFGFSTKKWSWLWATQQCASGKGIGW